MPGFTVAFVLGLIEDFRPLKKRKEQKLEGISSRISEDGMDFFRIVEFMVIPLKNGSDRAS